MAARTGDGEQPAHDTNAEARVKYLYGLKPDKSVISGHATRTAAAHCAYMMPSLHTLIVANPDRGLQLLDVGCGPGSITIDFAQTLAPSGGTVIGVDLSATVLESAKMRAVASGVEGNTTFQPADVYALPFPDGHFDVVHAHQAVAHFHDRVKAIREMLRVTRKDGGMLCMREGDLHTARFYPDSPALEACFDIVKRAHARNGGATDAGRQLKKWTVKAGVPHEHITATNSAWSYNTPEGRREYGAHWPGRCTNGAFADAAKAMGVTEQELEGYALAWKRWVDDEDGSFSMMQGEVIARPRSIFSSAH